MDIKLIEATRNINIYPELNNFIQFSLNSINKIKDFFVSEINETKALSKIFRKYFNVWLSSQDFTCFISTK